MADPFTIDFTRSAYAHMEALRRYDRNAVLDAIKRQLAHTPAQETRNRKLLRDNPVADWELRVGRLRVFYEVNVANHLVRVLAVGVKEGSKLAIGGTEVDL